MFGDPIWILFAIKFNDVVPYIKFVFNTSIFALFNTDTVFDVILSEDNIFEFIRFEIFKLSTKYVDANGYLYGYYIYSFNVTFYLSR